MATKTQLLSSRLLLLIHSGQDGNRLSATSRLNTLHCSGICVAFLLLVFSSAVPASGFAQGTAFTYQGRLQDAGNAAGGLYDFQLRIFDSATVPGNAVAGPLTNSATIVTAGLFTVTMDFGVNVFTGSERWLEIGVRTNGVGAFLTLAPRQLLTPAPYAITAGAVSGTVAAGQLSGQVPLANLPTALLVTNGQMSVNLGGAFAGDGSGLTNLNGANLSTGVVPDARLSANVALLNQTQTFTGANVFNNPTNSFSGNGGGLTNVTAATLGGLSSDGFWQLGGNNIASSQFLGTTNNQALEIRVNNVRALRLEPTAVPSLEGGYFQNSTHGATSAAIVGGGTSGSINEVLGDYGFVGAGHGAKVGGFSAVVDGAYNDAQSQFSFVGAGLRNTNRGDYSFIGGGTNNFVQPAVTHAFIGGGGGNYINDSWSVISGGYSNTSGSLAVVGGGLFNSASANLSTVGGGEFNTASSPGATVSGGEHNTASGVTAMVSGGTANLASGLSATVGGGNFNSATNALATVAGGYANTATGYATSVAGGYGNVAAGRYASVGGGGNNSGDLDYATVSGGGENHASGPAATIGGGVNNTAGVNAATVSGGSENHASGDHGTISGGQANLVGGPYDTIGGGVNNAVGADVFGSAIFGGSFNTISTGSFSSIIGGGTNNLIGLASPFATVGGGGNNTAVGEGATVSGGTMNQALDYSAAIGGGYGNIAYFEGTVAGGDNNRADAPRATVSGGVHNEAGGDSAFVGGGEYNTAIAEGSVVGGGGFDGVLFAGNRVNAACGTICGGLANSAENSYAFIGGGMGNTNQGFGGALAGGWFNLAAGNYVSVGGGASNKTSAYFATVPGGFNNFAAGTFSFAAGQRAQALHQGAFVWADSQSVTFASTANDQFSIRARGGVRFNEDTSLFFGTDPPRQVLNLWGTQYGIGVQSLDTYFRTDTGGAFFWYAGGSYNSTHGNAGGGTRLMQLDGTGLIVNGTFVSLSDRNVKEHFEPVDSRGVLEKVVALPVSTWNYKTDPASRHIGPMAQDFYASFEVGGDDKHIATVDEGGVALAAIQGLAQELKEKDARIQDLEQRLSALEKLIRSQR